MCMCLWCTRGYFWLGMATHDIHHSFATILPKLRLDYFDFIVTPQTAGFSKPDTRYFKICEKKICDHIRLKMMQSEVDFIYGKTKRYDVYSSHTKRDEYYSKQSDVDPYYSAVQEIIRNYDTHFDEYMKQIKETETFDFVHVGHSLQRDVMGALASDWRAAWVVRHDEHFESNLNTYKQKLEAAGVDQFGLEQWNEEYKKRVTIVNNLFDMHHQCFLW